MKEVRQLSVFAENKPGRLAVIVEALGHEGIDILGMNIASAGSFGVLKFLVNDCDRAHRILTGKGFTVSTNEVFAIEMQDRPGGLYQVVEVLARCGINIEYAYGLPVVPGKRAIFVAEVKDIENAKRLLQGEDLTFLGEEDIRREMNR